MFKRHIDYLSPAQIGSWRKMTLGTYKQTGDCQAYCLQTIDATALVDYMGKNSHLKAIHLIGRACAMMIERYPEVNRVIRWGRFYPRKNLDIFFQVAENDIRGELSGHVVRGIDKKNASSIALDMKKVIKDIKAGDDKAHKKVKGRMKKMPGLLMTPLFKFLECILYELNLWSPVLGTPKDPFGAMMITNIGSLGFQTGFAPLVAYSRCGLILAIGKIYDKAIVNEEGKVVAQKAIDFGWTLDHRLIDGALAAKMGLYFEELLLNPERLEKI